LEGFSSGGEGGTSSGEEGGGEKDSGEGGEESGEKIAVKKTAKAPRQTSPISELKTETAANREGVGSLPTHHPHRRAF
jgi:hypothetical protein